MLNNLIRQLGSEADALKRIELLVGIDERIKEFRPAIYYIDMSTEMKITVPRISHL